MRAARRKSSELVGSIPLQIEQRRQVAVVHAIARLCLHLRLGVQRHAHAGFAQHGEVVGPVAHGERIRRLSPFQLGLMTAGPSGQRLSDCAYVWLYARMRKKFANFFAVEGIVMRARQDYPVWQKGAES